MEMNFYAVIPSAILTSKNISSNEKILYGVISALTNSKGYCYASNAALTEFFDKGGNVTHQKTISRWVNNLVKLGYITSKLIRTDTKQVDERQLRLVDKIVVEKVIEKIVEKTEEETVSNADTSINLVINYLNKIVGKNYNNKTKGYRDLIRKHFEEGRTMEDFMRVIEVKSVDEWFVKNPQYFAPTTLFSLKKFDGYLNSWTFEIRQSIYNNAETTKKNLNLSKEEF